jgi:hypothetical protein
MRRALIVVMVLAASVVEARDAEVEGVCETLRQMAELASETETAARAASDLGNTRLGTVSSDHPVVAEAGRTTARASTLAREAADLTRSIVHSIEEMCPSALDPA